jgi:hypothetical protein
VAIKEPERLLSTPRYSAEEFICQGIRGNAKPWSALAGLVSANELLELCSHHGVSPLLFHAASLQKEWQDWPPDLKQGLTNSSKSGIAQELFRSQQLAIVLSVLNENGVQCLVTKGEALAKTLYPIPGTRKRSDSDLFIAINDIEVARQAILDAGLVINTPVYKSHQFTARRKSREREIIGFDIHWRILNAARFARVLTFEEAYAGSIEIPAIEGARTLNSGDALLLACMHRLGNVNHNRNRLIWIYDIHLLVESMGQRQLEEFAAKARDKNVRSACLDGLSRSIERFQTNVPMSVLKDLGNPELPMTFRQKLTYSHFGLILHDMISLPDFYSRYSLFLELIEPSVGSSRRNV